MEKLTDREVDVMNAIWTAEIELVPTGDILRQINRAKRNSLQTLQVVLRRLCEKGVIRCEKGRQTNYYAALITQKEYLDFAGKNFIAHHYPKNAFQFVTWALSGGAIQLTDTQKAQIEKILREHIPEQSS